MGSTRVIQSSRRRHTEVFLAVLVAVAGLLGYVAATPAQAAERPAPASTMLPEAAPPAAAIAASTAAATRLGATYNSAKVGSGKWYWPVGTEDFQGWSGWHDPRGSYVHVAQDMPAKVGQPVYAIGDGKVWISRADTGGYGVNGSAGGCMIIVHKTADGREFRATYGHVQGLRYAAGATVKAGAVIATINGCAHLHFGIHPSTSYRDGNPYAGHVPATWSDHGGFVNPVSYMKTYPRVIVYAPPVWPAVKVTTAVAPAVHGAAAGNAYWTEATTATVSAATSSTLRAYEIDLDSGVRHVYTGETLPAFDTTRYNTALLTVPTIGFVVNDKLPVAQIATPHSSPVWGERAKLTMSLKNDAGKPFDGAFVSVQKKTAKGWVTVARPFTRSDGTATASVSVSRAEFFRVAFAPPASQPATRSYCSATCTGELRVMPHVALSSPLPRTQPVAGRQVIVGGYMKPKHPAGQQSVVFEIWRYVGGAWQAQPSVPAINFDTADGRTRYVNKLTFAARGSWRIRATHPIDDLHARSLSTTRTITVR